MPAVVTSLLRARVKQVRDLANRRLGDLAGRHRDLALQTEIDRLAALDSAAALRPLEEIQDNTSNIATTWRGLGSVGYQIVRQFRPRVAVELGSFGGFSTCALGLALRDHVPGGRLYAVDTWQGDAHAGNYAGEVLNQFTRFRQTLGLEEVIVPLRMTFEEAVRHVPRGIELLHIDGLHSWRAVSRDFRTYRPLLAPKALVLFHDVNAHFLGMRLFWLLASRRYQTALVPFSCGLGVLLWNPSGSK
jgi:predicted O-methyltransferase YrrM